MFIGSISEMLNIKRLKTLKCKSDILLRESAYIISNLQPASSTKFSLPLKQMVRENAYY
jgi:Cft2 family RNA processing exonuclease